ncbi:MAG: DUF1320 domain-containing protein [Candidatus Diapherotrites archaeon]|nr:DUF1320 domain-containing protein [Candidatus Diapherotrites archaeon]
MSYCTVDDLRLLLPEDELIELSDDSGVGELDESVVARAIEEAAREVDAYVGLVRTVPIPEDEVPGLVRDITARLAIFHLFRRRALRLEQIPEVWQKEREQALRTLERIARGQLKLTHTDTEEQPAPFLRPVTIGRA